MVELTVRLTAASGSAHRVIEALHARMRRTRRQSGCAGAHIAADVDEANTFWYSEDWQDAAALEREMRTDRFAQLVTLMETSATPPLLEFRLVSETRGLEYVAATRSERLLHREVDAPAAPLAEPQVEREVGSRSLVEEQPETRPAPRRDVIE